MCHVRHRQTAMVEPSISGTTHVPVVGVHLWKDRYAYACVFNSRFDDYGLRSQMDLISNSDSAIFYPTTLGKIILFLLCLDVLICNSEKRTPVSSDGCEDDMRASARAWPTTEGVRETGALPPLLAGSSLFSRCMP